MSVDLLEINDLGVSLTGEHGRIESPGYALLDGAALTLGEQARARARMQPRQVVSQFWSRLGTDPIPNATGRARHHADLAWAHLNELHQRAGKPDELVIAVPASMSRDQLGILLGIAERCDFATIGLVDSATAAAAGNGCTGPVIHVDLQLHQCVLTRIGVDNNTLVREAAEVVPATGWLQLMERWAAMATAGFVRQCRFDPLHAAQTEQQLYDSIPAWLDALSTSTEISAELRSANNSYRATFRRDDFVNAAAPVLAQLGAALKRFNGNTPLLLSHRCAQLPGIEELGHPFQRVDHEATLRGCVENIDLLRSDDGSVRFINRLRPVAGQAETAMHAPVEATSDAPPPPSTQAQAPAPAEPAPTPKPAPATPTAAKPSATASTDVAPGAGLATHLLLGTQICRLNPSGTAIGDSNGQWLFGTRCETPLGLIVLNGDHWQLQADAGSGLTLNGRRLSVPAEVIAGDRIGLAGSDIDELRLIAEQH